MTAACLALAVMSSAACNPGRPPAAQVGSTDISAERIDEIIAAAVEVDPETFVPEVEGDGEGTYALDEVARLLNTVVLQAAQAELADREGASPTEAERTEAEELVRNSFSAGAIVPPDTEASEEQLQAQEDSSAIFDALSEDTQEWLVDLRAHTLALGRIAQEQVSGGGARGADDPVCLRAIVVDAAQVEPVQQRLADGEDFGDVSSEVTIDPQLAEAGGSLGEDCLTATQYEQAGLEPQFVAVISELDFGEVSDPVDLGEGVVALFEVRQDSEAALATYVVREIDGVEIKIDPRFGTWDPETGEITPPAGARGD
jgi:hypothetical protein